MAGAYENSIHQWRVIVVIVVDCECALTLDESAREHYTISANEAGSRAHKAAGASAPVVGLQNLCCEFESYCPCHENADSRESAFFLLLLYIPHQGRIHFIKPITIQMNVQVIGCLLYTSDAADE